jgi:hypothetical protein
MGHFAGFIFILPTLFRKMSFLQKLLMVGQPCLLLGTFKELQTALN